MGFGWQRPKHRDKTVVYSMKLKQKFGQQSRIKQLNS